MRNSQLVVALAILAIILMAIGGFADITEQKRIAGMSKQHYWSDGISLLVLSDWIVLWNHARKPSATSQ